MNREADQSTFKNEVKQWLKSHDFDYKWMADQCGVSEITVRNWMSQKTIPALKQQLIERVMVQMPASLPSSPSSLDHGVQVNASLSLTIKLSPDIYSRLEAKAMEQDQTVAEMVTQAISNLVTEPPSSTKTIKTHKVILPSQS